MHAMNLGLLSRGEPYVVNPLAWEFTRMVLRTSRYLLRLHGRERAHGEIPEVGDRTRPDPERDGAFFDEPDFTSLTTSVGCS